MPTLVWGSCLYSAQSTMPSLGFEIDLCRMIGVPRAFCQRSRLRFQTGCCRNDPGESGRIEARSNLQAMRGAEESRLSDNIASRQAGSQPPQLRTCHAEV